MNILCNFIDRTFTVLADLLLKLFPASKRDKQAYAYYQAGLKTQSKGRYNEALCNFYESLKIDEDPIDRSFTLFNIGKIYGDTGRKAQALEFYHQAVELNDNMPQALNGIAVIYHSQGMRAEGYAKRCTDDDEYNEYMELASDLYDKAAEYWNRALELAPDTYPGARNWLKVTGRLKDSNKSY